MLTGRARHDPLPFTYRVTLPSEPGTYATFSDRAVARAVAKSLSHAHLYRVLASKVELVAIYFDGERRY